MIPQTLPQEAPQGVGLSHGTVPQQNPISAEQQPASRSQAKKDEIEKRGKSLKGHVRVQPRQALIRGLPAAPGPDGRTEGAYVVFVPLSITSK
jgi:hypothetical protein